MEQIAWRLAGGAWRTKGGGGLFGASVGPTLQLLDSGLDFIRIVKKWEQAAGSLAVALAMASLGQSKIGSGYLELGIGCRIIQLLWGNEIIVGRGPTASPWSGQGERGKYLAQQRVPGTLPLSAPFLFQPLCPWNWLAAHA